jgi:hypothetical protein
MGADDDFGPMRERSTDLWSADQLLPGIIGPRGASEPGIGLAMPPIRFMFIGPSVGAPACGLGAKGSVVIMGPAVAEFGTVVNGLAAATGAVSR